MENIRGGQFIVKESQAENIFTPEDFTEEQQMMRDSVKEFVDRELWPNKERFEKKDYAFTEEAMKKAGELGFFKCCSSRKLRWFGNGICFYRTYLRLYFWCFGIVFNSIRSTHRNWNYANYLVWK